MMGAVAAHSMGCQKEALGRTRALGWPATGRVSLLPPILSPPHQMSIREGAGWGRCMSPKGLQALADCGLRSLQLRVQLPSHRPNEFLE